MRKIAIYDTTLRDGCQAEGVAFSVADKVRVAERLDDLGVDYIEGGWPNETNLRDREFYAAMRDVPLRRAKLAAFGSTRRGDIAPEDDRNLQALLEAGAPVITIFGKSWDLHVTEVLRVSRDENLRMVEDSVAYLLAQGREVIFDGEHFFDGYRADREYAVETLLAAVRGGAKTLVLCDTNGGALPLDAARIVGAVQERLKDVVRENGLTLGIHAHNDSGMAVATSQIAVEHGCDHVQGTINGYGERCGNANLCTIIPTLELKMGLRCLPEGKLQELTELSRYVSELANLAHDDRQPYVGASAFAHKGGMHIDAVMKVPSSFEQVSPESVGNTRRFLMSDQAGGGAIVAKLLKLKPELDKRSPEVRELLRRVKELENRGYQFEGAEGSFELMAQKVLGTYERLWELLGFRVIVEKREDGRILSEATVKVRLGEEEVLEAGEGNGPVNALDGALRKALGRRFPELADITLTDYKVRVLNADAGTAASVRVLIESTDGEDEWGTVGAHENVIDASWQALADSLEYGLQKRLRRRGGQSEER